MRTLESAECLRAKLFECALKIVGFERPLQYFADQADGAANLTWRDTDHDLQNAHLVEALDRRIDGVGERVLLAQRLKERRSGAAAERLGEQLVAHEIGRLASWRRKADRYPGLCEVEAAHAITSGKSCTPRRAAPAWLQIRELTANDRVESLGIDIADADQHHVRCAIVTPEISVEFAAMDRANHAPLAEHRAAKRLTRKCGLVHQILREALGVIADVRHLLQHDAPLALELLGRKHRAPQHIGDELDGDAELVARKIEVVAGVIFCGERVHVRAGALGIDSDAIGVAAASAFEHHVFEEVRDAGELERFIARSHAHIGADARGAKTG